MYYENIMKEVETETFLFYKAFSLTLMGMCPKAKNVWIQFEEGGYREE
jgi:hypothetical protein